MTIHLAYLLPPSTQTYSARFKRLLKGHIQVDDVAWPVPTGSPYSITRHLAVHLAQYDTVKLYDWSDRKAIRLDPGDLFIFHPTPIAEEMPRPERSWTSAEPSSIGVSTLRSNPGCRAVLIVPYTSETNGGWLASILKEHRVKVITLCGSFWENAWLASPYKDLCPGRLRIPMGIEPSHFPNVRSSFNRAGHRSFLYIGHTSYIKNTAQLGKIRAAWPEFRCAHIGFGTIEGIPKVSENTNLTPQFMRSVASTFDFVISTSDLDAQATTMLEAICWGFPIACTPETGFSGPGAVSLSKDDTAANVRALQNLDSAPEADLYGRLKTLRAHVETQHAWTTIAAEIANFLNLSRSQ